MTGNVMHRFMVVIVDDRQDRVGYGADAADAHEAERIVTDRGMGAGERIDVISHLPTCPACAERRAVTA